MDPFNTVEDIIIDPSFRRWILHQDLEAGDQWHAYLSAHPEKKALVEKAKLWLEELPKVSYQMSEQELALLWHQIERKSEQPVPSVPLVAVKVRNFPWLYLAACITAVLLSVVFWHSNSQKFTTTYQTHYGETREVILPDGSLVTLNANSTLSFDSEQFNAKMREVWMQGEAFFEVTKLTSDEGNTAKFIVHTDDLEVEVLGTQFNVNTRRSGTKVVLTEGRVRLNLSRIEGKQPVNMLPGEMVTYTPEKKAVIKKENVNLKVYTAWKKKELVFEDTPVREIIEVLEDNYGIKVILQNKEIAKRHYKGTFKNPDPEIILTVITAVLQLEMERNNNVIILK